MLKSIELIKTKLEAKLSGKIRNFYIGDPWIIPTSSLPCIIINPISTETDFADNARDVHIHTIEISLVIDARQYFNKTPNEMVGTRFLVETMEKEDSLGNIDATTICDILRSNLDLGTNRFIDNISNIDYTIRKRTEDLITLEAVARLNAKKITIR